MEKIPTGRCWGLGLDAGLVGIKVVYLAAGTAVRGFPRDIGERLASFEISPLWLELGSFFLRLCVCVCVCLFVVLFFFSFFFSFFCACVCLCLCVGVGPGVLLRETSTSGRPPLVAFHFRTR